MSLRGFDPKLWARLGTSLRELVIFESRIPAEVLYQILRDFPMLEALEFEHWYSKSSKFVYGRVMESSELHAERRFRAKPFVIFSRFPQILPKY